MSTDQVNEEAASWAVRVNGPDFSEAEHAQLHEWILVPENAKAFRLHYAVLVLAPELSGRLAIPTPRLGWASSLQGRRASIALLAGAAAVALFLWLGGVLLFKPELYSTRTGEIRAFHLSDGSTATLDTRSRVQVALDRSERHVTLLEGRARFDVRTDPHRPFVVEVGSGEIRVLGTKFEVYRRHADGTHEETTLSVLRGSVEVSGREGSAGRAWTRQLEAEQTLTFGPAGITSDVRPFAAGQRLTWTSHIFEAQNLRLSAVIDELSRYTDTPIVLADGRLNGINIVATLDLGDVRRALHELRDIVPVEVEEAGNTFVLHYREQPPVTATQRNRGGS